MVSAVKCVNLAIRRPVPLGIKIYVYKAVKKKKEKEKRKDEYPSFVATWTGLEEIMLSEISQAKRVNYHMVSLICGA